MAIKDTLNMIVPRGQLARGSMMLMAGTFAGQFLVVLASPVLTRLYGPEDFGLLAVFMALLGILGGIASLRYNHAVPLPEDDSAAAALVMLGLLIVLVMGGLCLLLLLTLRHEIAQALNVASIEPYLLLLPVSVVLVGTYEIFYYWALRKKAFSAIAKTNVIRAIGMVAIQAGGSTFGPVALLLGLVTGQSAGVSTLAALAARRSRTLFQSVRLSQMGELAWRYRRFPIFDTWHGILTMLGAQLPSLLFAVLFGPAAAGYYVLSQQVVGTPMAVVGNAVGGVFFSDATEAKRQGRLTPLVTMVHERLAQIAMAPALLLMLAGPDLFVFVFGAEWRQSGEFAQWMAPWLYFQFVSAPLSPLFYALEEQAAGTVFAVLQLVIRASALAAGAMLGDLMLAVALFAAGSAACYAGMLIWIFHASKCSPSAVAGAMGRALAWAVIQVSPLIGVLIAGADGPFVIGAIILSAALIAWRYFFLLRQAA